MVLSRLIHVFPTDVLKILSKHSKQLFYCNYAMDVSGMRAPYQPKCNAFLEEHIAVKEPLNLFQTWFEEVKNCKDIIEPNAVCLATASKDGFPSARYILCKSFSKDGFKFFTPYSSRKGQELEENPKASLVFYWPPFNRSVRIEGRVEKLPFSEADAYFHNRPYASQIGALCSNQSKPIQGRHILEKKASELKEKHGEGQVPRPELWGGYIVVPNSIEFWQGQTDRIHDRIRFRKPVAGESPDGVLTHQGEDGWIYERLAP